MGARNPLICRKNDGKGLKTMAFITAKTISEEYAIPLGTIYYYIYHNKIPFIRIMGRIKFEREVIANWINKGNQNNANEKVW